MKNQDTEHASHKIHFMLRHVCEFVYQYTALLKHAVIALQYIIRCAVLSFRRRWHLHQIHHPKHPSSAALYSLVVLEHMPFEQQLVVHQVVGVE